jgi:hypothetical protein
MGTLAATFFWIVSILPLGMGDIVRVTWRPVVATVAMAAAVLGVMQLWGSPPEIYMLVLHALTLAALGAVVYTVALLAIWIACGRPAGAEPAVLSLVESRARLGFATRGIRRLLGPQGGSV